MNKSIFFMLMITVSLCGYARQTKQFHGISAGEADGLRNPERGLRLEVYLNVDSPYCSIWNPAEKFPEITTSLEQEVLKYESDSITLVQTYFYLTDIVGKPLEQRHFDAMQVFLDKLKSLGMKAVLRFAYETGQRAKSGPTKEDILLHVHQLKPFLEANKDVIFVLQAGLIGAWGEWHSSFHGLEKSDETKRSILSAVCDIAPQGRFVQVRVPSFGNLLKDDTARYKKISFHDDMIVIKPHGSDGKMSEGTPNYNQIVNESPYLPVDGELPWGRWIVSYKDAWLIDGNDAARRFFMQHFTSLSATHNYKEGGADDKFSMIYWQETPIGEDFLKENKMPVSDAYFRKKNGTPAERTQFDYIRDHLGYRIELQQLKTNPVWKRGSVNQIDISLINRGFSTLHNEHPVYIVLTDATGKVCHKTLTAANVNDWQPYNPPDTIHKTPLVHHITAQTVLPDTLPAGKYRLGLWIPDGSETLMYNPKFAIRCANSDTEWTINDEGYGINNLITIIY
jgi:hypothetical protein